MTVNPACAFDFATAPAPSSSVSGIDPSQMEMNPAVDRFSEPLAKAAALGFQTGN